jgi:hypothetical protein
MRPCAGVTAGCAVGQLWKSLGDSEEGRAYSRRFGDALFEKWSVQCAKVSGRARGAFGCVSRDGVARLRAALPAPSGCPQPIISVVWRCMSVACDGVCACNGAGGVADSSSRICACVRVCCVCVCVRACAYARVRVCVCACACVRTCCCVLTCSHLLFIPCLPSSLPFSLSLCSYISTHVIASMIMRWLGTRHAHLFMVFTLMQWIYIYIYISP